MSDWQPEAVELIPAFMWICPHCGRNQFEAGVVVELSEDEMTELRDDHGVDSSMAGEFISAPHKVTCNNCSESYQTKRFRED